MNAQHAGQVGRLVVALLLFAVALTPSSLAQGPSFSPPDAVQGQSFSVTTSSVSTTEGLHPADVLGANGLISISCVEMGLLCTDPDSGTSDDLAAFSFGRDFNDPYLPPIQFSVSAGAQGAANSAVAAEAGCASGQAHADVFETSLDGTNAQDLDGDGTACSTNTGLSLGLFELPDADEADELDALAQDPCQSIDFDCNGALDAPIFLVLSSGSPSLAFFGVTTADILVTRNGAFPEIWATGSADLGLLSGDAIDALCVEEDGDGIFGEDDNILFSLAPGSPSLSALSAGPATLLTSAPLQRVADASSLGLANADNVDALGCGALVVQQTDGGRYFFPIIGNNPTSP